MRLVFFDVPVFLGKYGRDRTNPSMEISKKGGIYQLQGIVGIVYDVFSAPSQC
jgi:hypothetical protein